MVSGTRALAAIDPVRRTLVGALAAFGFDPVHAVTIFTVIDSTNDKTITKLAGAEEVSA
jgi:hypothetical protein